MNLAGLDLNLIVVLNALLEEESVTKAGQRVGLSQPAVSNALARLRYILNDPILEREGRGMRLTARAHLMKTPLQAILDDLSKVLREPVSFEPASATFNIKMFASDYTTFVLLPEIRKRLNRLAPGAQLEITWSEQGRVIDLLEHGEIDFAVGLFANMPSSIHRARLFEDRNVVQAHRDHPIFEGDLTLERLNGYPRIAVSFDGRRYGPVERAISRAGGDIDADLVTPHALIGPLATCETDLLTLTSERLARRLAPLLPIQWRPVPFDLDPIQIELLWHHRSTEDPAKTWFRDELLALAATL